jgi:hypothetical protein
MNICLLSFSCVSFRILIIKNELNFQEGEGKNFFFRSYCKHSNVVLDLLFVHFIHLSLNAFHSTPLHG